MNERTNLNQITDCVLLALLDRLGPGMSQDQDPDPPPESSRRLHGRLDQLECIEEEAGAYRLTGDVLEVMGLPPDRTLVGWSKGCNLSPNRDSVYIDVEAVLEL